MEQNIYLFDIIEERFEFYYNKNENIYYCIDKNENKKYNLPVKIRKYKESKKIKEVEVIRFWFPTPNNFKTKVYQKVVKKIQFELFGIFDSDSSSKLILSLKNCKDIIKNKFDELGYLMGYTEMIQSSDPLIRKTYYVISQNGGSEKFNEIVNELGLSSDFHYTNDNGIFFTSSYEFIFFSILHYNNIKYEFEPFKVGSFEPDFYIPEFNYLVEILGLITREKYNQRSKTKEKLYTNEGYDYKPIIVDRHNPRESILERCKEIFGDIKTPNFNDYYRKYILTSENFNKNLKKYLTEINNGNLRVVSRKDRSGFSEKHRKYYEYIANNYGTVQIAIKELIGIPSTKFRAIKIEPYWRNIQYVKDEIENVFKNEKRIPSKYEIRIKYRNKYNIWNLYRFWGEKSLEKGGVFYNFIEELKLKYGYTDVDLERRTQKEKAQKDFNEEVYRVVSLVLNTELPINGKESLFTNYRSIYDYLNKNYGHIFYYIKKNIGYPPPHILRPKGYYKIEENVKYELEENWKKYKKILSDSERVKDKGRTNTYYNMIASVGIKEFQSGGKYYKFIEQLKLKYGYDDSKERKINDFQNNLRLFLEGINEGKWNTKTLSSKELGDHTKFLTYIHSHYKNVFIAVKELIGFPKPNVVRYHKYYDNIANCKNEIENIIKIYGHLPLHSELNRSDIPHKQILKTIYAKYKIKEFKKGGIFYKLINK